jgi:pyruvate formate lyase activating enzyme
MRKIPIIRGFNKCSEAGIDTFAPAIFLEGCNLRCPYCMNANLVKCEVSNDINIDKIKEYVLENKSEWFMISGGEPTCTMPGLLIALLKEIKSWGCKIGISSNGMKAERLETILSYLNYVALDIKSSKMEYYKKIHRDNKVANDLMISRNLLIETKLKRDDFNYEIRTTLYPPFIDREALKEIGSIIRKDDIWVLQQFRHSKSMLSPDCINVKPYGDQEVKALLKVAKSYTDKAFLRYV